MGVLRDAMKYGIGKDLEMALKSKMAATKCEFFDINYFRNY